MHKIVDVVVCVLLLLGIAGCAKKSGMIGNVLDAQGKPLAGLKIIASQVQPVKGYEKFETVSGPDGSFEFKKLFPLSDYVLKPWSDKWMTNAKLDVKTAPAGENLALPQALTIRFTSSKKRVIADSLTELEWLAGPNRDMDWHAAKRWVKGLFVAGGGWRMPTELELKSLYDEEIRTEYKIDPVFALNACCVWTGEKQDSLSARNFSFKPRILDLGHLDNSYRNRAFAVRSRK
jgi:hypothetical protein